MILADQTLEKLRLMEASLPVLTELSQEMDDYVREVQDFYRSQGINVSEKVIRTIIDVLGVENAKTEAGANLAQRIKKNPKRMILTVLDSGVMDSEEIKKLINDKANEANNQQIADEINKLIDLLTKVEMHASGAHSVGITTSGDVYAIYELLKQKFGDDSEIMKMVPMLIKFLEQQLKSGEPPLYKENLTGKEVVLAKNGQRGTVLIDTDDPNLSQEFIDAMRTKMSRITTVPAFTVDDLKSVPHQAIIYLPVLKEIVAEDKAKLMPYEFSPVMNAIMQDPTVEGRIAQFEDKVVRKALARGFGKVGYNQRQMDQMNRARGYDVDRYKQIMGIHGANNSVQLEITPENKRSAAIQVLQWMTNNLSSAKSINIGGNAIILYGSVQGDVVTGSEWKIKFFRESYSIANIERIMMFKIDENKYNSFDHYKKANGLSVQVDYNADRQELTLTNLR